MKKGDLADAALATSVVLAGGFVALKLFSKVDQIYKDRKIWVRDFKDLWLERYATGDFTDDGIVICYSGMDNSKTSKGDLTYWEVYSLTDPTK